MKHLLIWIISILLILHSRSIVANHDVNTGIRGSTTGNLNSKTRIAFVFAGSARSFIMPPVHESIRHNLLNAMYAKISSLPPTFI